ncbi:hypothetical protein [Pseudomonas sp. FP2338]|uniref:hypothetical protein n=1 Tax=Pseudomonas sp. FP2338 TaxID=2954093 RepID=UPI00273356AC|nr:hypothetical protein [Pseudomonas sp. FP2338]WLH87576.1 hypothetical protein PSH96_14325 [Pseudomonas sp. FP2338]
MIVSISNSWAGAYKEHTAFLNRKIDLFVNPKRKYGKRIKKPLQHSVKFVNAIRYHLTSTELPVILDSIAVFNTYAASAGKSRLRFISEITYLFNYENFRTKKIGWDAYKLCLSSTIKVCPYCQQIDIPTLLDQNTGRGFRPPLDHYFCKTKYPHLALSLGNLIPSCTNCNTNLKEKADFFNEAHLHPFHDEENIFFSLCRTSGELFIWDDITKGGDFLRVGVSAGNSCDKTLKSLETFMISQRYGTVEIALEAIDYAVSKLDWEGTKDNTQIAVIRGARNKESALTQFDRANYKNLRLGKLRADIHDLLS